MNSKRFAIVLCLLEALLLLSSALLTQAQPSGVTVSTDAPQYSTAFSSQRKVVRDTEGDLFVAYLRLVNNFSQVFLSRSDDNGRTWKDMGQVSEGDYQSARVSIAIDASNRIHIFWTKFIGENGQEYGQIYYRTYSTSGWSNEEQLTSGDAYSGYPSACIDSKGHIHLVWYGFDGIAYQVYYESFDGSHWSDSIKLSQGFPDSVNPTVAVDSSNNIHVAWFKSNGRNYQINYIDWTGTWNKQVVLSRALTDAFNPTMAIAPNGRIYIVWDEGTGPITQIYYSVFDGSVWSQETSLTSGASAQNPSVAVDGQGNVYVFYEKSDGQIYTRTYDNAWLPERELTSSGLNTYPSARWSYNNNPLNGAGGRIDFVWTSKEPESLSVKYGSLVINKSQSVNPLGQNGYAIVPFIVTIIVVGTVLVAAVYFRQKFKRPRRS